MGESQVQTLMHAVRRRLWLLHGFDAARVAAWTSAAWLLGLLALHLAAGPVPASAAVGGLALAWVAAAAWAARQRPTDADCALWADRHLGGACAFSTLLELQPDDAARPRLHRWAAERVPEVLRRLAERPAPPRLAQPLLTLASCLFLSVSETKKPGRNQKLKKMKKVNLKK